MDCRNARYLLEFARPQGYDLDTADRQALESHLAVCPDCDALARGGRQFDEHLGRAIRDVPLPAGMKERLLDRLRQEREAWYRQLAGRGLRWFGAAAAILLALFIGLKVRDSRRDLDPDAVVYEIRQPYDSPIGYDQARDWLKGKGLKDLAPPEEFNYSFLRACCLADFQGKLVPMLLFERPLPSGRSAQLTRVYILPEKLFNLKELPERFAPNSGENFKVQIRKPESRTAYVIVYIGDLKDMLVNDNAAGD